MTRNIRVAAAQRGPIQKSDSRQAVVARMLELMRRAAEGRYAAALGS
jgi:hypothetical protein